MNNRHRIRLAGPWEAEILQSSSHREITNKRLKTSLDGPGEPKLVPFCGNLKLRRNFNLPTGLDKHSVVWLCMEGLSAPAKDDSLQKEPIPSQIVLNQQPLDKASLPSSSEGHAEVAVTDILESFNRLEIELSCSAVDTPVRIAEDAASVLVQASVWLEIA